MLKASESTGGNFARLLPKNPTPKNWLISSMKLLRPWTSGQRGSHLLHSSAAVRQNAIHPAPQGHNNQDYVLRLQRLDSTHQY
jgi:hypothetical protein